MSSIIDRLREFTRPTGEEELMDVAYPTPRLKVGVREAGAAAVILLLALVGWLGLRHSDQPGAPLTAVSIDQQVEPERLAAPSGNVAASPVSPTGVPTPAIPPPEELVVSVVGEVAHPGLVTLAPGARVADALAVAKPLEHAELQPLNQAQRLNDGEQINVAAHSPETVASSGLVGESSGGGSPGAPDAEGKIALNTATAAELMELSGVGEKTATAILNHREQIGGFATIEQLQEVKGIGPAKFAALKDLVTL